MTRTLCHNYVCFWDENLNYMGVKRFRVFRPSQIVNLVSSENRFGDSVDAILHVTQFGSFCVEDATVFSTLFQIWD